MATTLTGRKALLLAEGCKLKKQAKAIEERLSAIKDEMGPLHAGDYRNDAGDELQVAETEKFSDISPGIVLTYLKKMRMADRFPEIVKVQITALKKVVPDSVIEKWRVPLDSIYRWTWK